VPVAAAPVHQARPLTFVDSDSTREEVWVRLPAKVRQRVEARYGQLLQWWADDDEESRPSAVVLGDRALVTVEPTTNSSGGSAYRIAALPLDPASFRSVRVTGHGAQPAPAPAPAPAAHTGPGSDPGQFRINPKLAGFLGQLPARAQQLLQEPFLANNEEPDWRYHYRRTGAAHGLSAATLHVWCYLTDLRTVTFVAGTGAGARDGGSAGAWQLTCWRASRR
jgi:hypothetical protein